MKSRESIPLDGSPGLPYIESEGQVIIRDGFSRPSGHELEGGKTSKLGLQGRPSCLDVSARLGMVAVMVLCPCCSME
jgi:hypothetical protein